MQPFFTWCMSALFWIVAVWFLCVAVALWMYAAVLAVRTRRSAPPLVHPPSRVRLMIVPRSDDTVDPDLN